MNTNTALVEPNPQFVGKYEIFVARELVDPLQGDVPIRFMNVSDSDIKIYKNSIVANMEEVETLNVETHDVNSIFSGKSEFQHIEQELPVHLLKLFQDSSEELDERNKIELRHLLLKFLNPLRIWV